MGWILTLCIATVLAGQAFGQSAPINIMAGPERSTSLQVGQELGQLSESCGMDTTVHVSAGALDNLLAVKARTYTQLGLIQNDVLEYLTTYKPDVPDIANALRGIKVAFPLFPQEVHVLALGDVASLSDLDDRRVAIGEKDSGTFLTATVMLDLVGSRPAERLLMKPQAALDALKRGEIDAMFFVDGAPSRLFDDQMLVPAGLKFLKIDDPILSAVYETGAIPAGTYANVTEDTQTVTVQAIMIAYDYVPKGRNRYNTANCNMVASLTGLIRDRLDILQEQGHPKWQDVDPRGIVRDFELSKCAALGFDLGVQRSCRADVTLTPTQ